jgi:hypothetical protein
MNIPKVGSLWHRKGRNKICFLKEITEDGDFVYCGFRYLDSNLTNMFCDVTLRLDVLYRDNFFIAVEEEEEII